MKKLLITIALIGVTATVAFGQGQVAFLNSASTLISTNGTAVGGPAGTWYYGIFWAPSTQTDPTQFSWFGYGTNLASVGRMNGGSGATGSPAIAGQVATTTVNVLVRGWSANMGVPNRTDNGSAWNTVAAAIADPLLRPAAGFWEGQSTTAMSVVLGGGAQPIPTIFGFPPLASQVAGFSLSYLAAVPEPTTFALLGLGAAGLMIFRRRK